jgi:hypothetical protein
LEDEEEHQERFRRKLDRWKRVERQNLYEAPSLPTYQDLYIPTSASRTVFVDESEEEYEEEYEEDGYREEFEGREDEDALLEREAAIENVHRERMLKDLQAQVEREDELQDRNGRRKGRRGGGEQLEEDDEVGNRRRSFKRRWEATFWS